ncbi:PPK2 family polyphosphate kinase [Arachidicoccus rhizosphaerae]|nr:PPK2 family polyphosphate kinase [Arachidicoccus rhizosphaerae]
MAKLRLDKISADPPKDADKDSFKKKTKEYQKAIDEWQNKLYAAHNDAILIVFQGMDASGKDGAVRSVFSEVNPQGISVHSFKVPTKEELDHDFLWRIHKQTPEKGMIKIFNRSHYEDILVTRVHKTINDKTAKERMKSINEFEQLLTKNHTHILKFYLHITPEVQSERLAERMQIKRKMWKYNPGDAVEAKSWIEYQKCYEDCFEHCNEVPWIIVPANKNWYKEYIVAKAVHDLIRKINPKYPGLEQTS